MSIEIREETSADLEGIREVNRLAFGGEAEARLIDRLRADGLVVTSVVAVDAGQVIGHAHFSDLPIERGAEVIPAVALAPVAARPERHNEGIGSAVIRRGLELCRERGRAAAVVLGHPGYYPRFGFSAELGARLESPYSGPAFMAMELVPGALAAGGVACYPAAFQDLD